MVDPDIVAAVHVNEIASPDILRINICEVDILHDDIGSIVNEAESFAPNHASASDTYN